MNNRDLHKELTAGILKYIYMYLPRDQLEQNARQRDLCAVEQEPQHQPQPRRRLDRASLSARVHTQHRRLRLRVVLEHAYREGSLQDQRRRLLKESIQREGGILMYRR